jgi:hypothetical protein
MYTTDRHDESLFAILRALLKTYESNGLRLRLEQGKYRIHFRKVTASANSLGVLTFIDATKLQCHTCL